MNDLARLAELWETYVTASADNPNIRQIYLGQEDGSGQMVLVTRDGETVYSEQDPEIRWLEAERKPARFVTLLLAALADQELQGKWCTIMPQAIVSIRSLLTEAGYEPSELDVWEVYERARWARQEGER